MGYIKPLRREDLPQFADEFEYRDATAGYVSNSMLTMGHRPEILGAFIDFLDAVYQKGIVEQQIKVMCALMRSLAAGCRYCQAHTATKAQNVSIDQQKIETIWEFETSDLFSDRERAALRVARDASFVPNGVGPEHFNDLSRHFTDPEIVEIVSVISIFAFLNSFNDTLATAVEGIPRSFAERLLEGQSWAAGKHADL